VVEPQLAEGNAAAGKGRHWKWPPRTTRWNQRRWRCSPRRPRRHHPPRHRCRRRRAAHGSQQRACASLRACIEQGAGCDRGHRWPFAAPAAANDGQLGIQLAAWQPDSAIARRLREGPPSQLYDRYLAERDAHADSSAFFLDVADLLLEQGQRELALRVLSNLAEMDLDNRHRCACSATG
jgi:hypothetical protein